MAFNDVIINPEVNQATWAGLNNGQNGASAILTKWADKTVQVTGTFGTSTVTIAGSNDNINWFTLNDTAGTPNALSFTAAALKKINENPIWIRPQVGAGTGTGITVVIAGAPRY